MASCGAITRSGGRCRAVAIEGREWCYQHDPGKAEERRRNASRGGRSGGRGRPNADLATLKREVRAVIGGVLNDRLDKGASSVALQGYNILLRANEQERRVRETEELEDRVTELEELIEAYESDSRRRGIPAR